MTDTQERLNQSLQLLILHEVRFQRLHEKAEQERKAAIEVRAQVMALEAKRMSEIKSNFKIETFR